MTTRTFALVLGLFGVLCICGWANAADITITWYGHAMFAIEFADGPAVLTDPYEPGVWDMGYQVEPLDDVDVVTISHEHEDHNYYQLATGEPEILHGMSMSAGFLDTDVTIDDVRFHTVSTCHGASPSCTTPDVNAAFVIEGNGLRIAHLGDLGHVLTATQAEAIGKIDILLVPVGGGGPTINAAGANAVIQLLEPSVTIGMHYETPDLGWGLDPIDPFLVGKIVVAVDERRVIIQTDSLPAEPTVFVLPYE
ncbi:MBL fold metallo-hydrolase [Candidatus Bipolaricaulota bacterium]